MTGKPVGKVVATESITFASKGPKGRHMKSHRSLKRKSEAEKERIKWEKLGHLGIIVEDCLRSDYGYRLSNQVYKQMFKQRYTSPDLQNIMDEDRKVKPYGKIVSAFSKYLQNNFGIKEIAQDGGYYEKKANLGPRYDLIMETKLAECVGCEAVVKRLLSPEYIDERCNYADKDGLDKMMFVALSWSGPAFDRVRDRGAYLFTSKDDQFCRVF